MNIQDLYDAILEVNFEHWITQNELEITYKDFRLKIDLSYREKFEQYPLWDPEMETNLDNIADIVGNSLVEEASLCEQDNLAQERKTKLKEQLLSHVELFLRYKSMRFKQEYPQNRRLKRKDIWSIQKVDFDAGDIEEEDDYLEVFQDLINEGYYKMVESGGGKKHDIFHVLHV